MPESWLDPETSPFSVVDKSAYFSKMLDAAAEFVPALRNAILVGFLEGPRMVVAGRDDTDTRPSVVNLYDESYITIFSGKIDHSIWVAEDVRDILRKTMTL